MKSKLMSSPSPGVVGQVHEAVLVHRVGEAFRYSNPSSYSRKGCSRPRSYQRQFLRAAAHDQVRRTVAVHLAVHAEGFGEVHGLEGRGDAADVVHTGPQDVAGPALIHSARERCLPPSASGPMRECRDSRPARRRTTRSARPSAPRYQAKPSFSRPRPSSSASVRLYQWIGVEHQVDVRADRLAHRGAGLDVHLDVGRPGNRRHPGVQLDALVAARDQLLGEAAVFVRRGEAALELVAAHGVP